VKKLPDRLFFAEKYSNNKLEDTPVTLADNVTQLIKGVLIMSSIPNT
jgi:hypothetical protein